MLSPPHPIPSHPSWPHHPILLAFFSLFTFRFTDVLNRLFSFVASIPSPLTLTYTHARGHTVVGAAQLRTPTNTRTCAGKTQPCVAAALGGLLRYLFIYRYWALCGQVAPQLFAVFRCCSRCLVDAQLSPGAARDCPPPDHPLSPALVRILPLSLSLTCEAVALAFSLFACFLLEIY